MKDVLPEQVAAPGWHWLQLPMTLKGTRASKTFPCAPPHECLEAELDHLRSVGENVDDIASGTDWATSVYNHEHYNVPDDQRPVFPVAVYLDGIKYTRSVGPGRSDSLTA
eukprot:4675735-Pyramimonas_sp.AAC.1